MRIRAMVKTKDKVFAAGYPDKIEKSDPFATFRCLTNGELRVFSAKDGTLLGSMPLPLPPAFDGMSAANGKLFIAGEQGQILCLDGKDQ